MHAATSKRATRVDSSKCLAELWAWLAEVEAKADLLEVELACALDDQQRASITKGKASEGDSRSLISRRIWGSSQISMEACTQSFSANLDANVATWARRLGFTASFNAYKFIIRAHYPKANEAIRPLIPQNALLEEIVDFVR